MTTVEQARPPATADAPTGARCIRTGVALGDRSVRIGGRIRPPRDPVAVDALPLFRRQLQRPDAPAWLRALVAAFVVTIPFTFLWYVTRDWGDVIAALVAIATGVALGATVVAASGWRHGWQLSVVAVGFTLVAMIASANFVQRDQLQAGIDTLEPRWAAMRAMATEAAGGAPDPAGDATAGDDATTDDTDTDDDGTAAPAPPVIGGDSGGAGMIPDDAALAEDTLVGGILVPAGAVIPPPEIVAVMPTPAFALMGPEVMAVVWPDIPDERKAEFDPALVAEVEALIAAAEANDAAREPGADGLTLQEARAIYDESNYDIPEPVLVCAPPPDLTQPDAAAGLGFPDGVPLFLPMSDYYQDRERGDGLEVSSPTPWCFARENAKAEPLEAASWLVAIALAALIPARRRLALVEGDQRRRARFEQIVGGS